MVKKYLQEAIDSILRQTYKDFEFIIVNDGSKDGTGDILNKVTDSRVKSNPFFKNNEGSVKRLNYAIDLAEGDWIFIQDADDISLESRIEKQVNYIQNSDSNLVVLGAFMKCIEGEDQIPTPKLEAIEKYWNTLDTHKKSVMKS
ncbi:hypothetical protein GCM10020331_077850 [Ectobacillus funiculus]